MTVSAWTLPLVILFTAFSVTSALPEDENLGGQHGIVTTYISDGRGGKPLILGLNNFNTMKVNCPSGTCTIVLNAQDKICNANGYSFLIVISVDGQNAAYGQGGYLAHKCSFGVLMGEAKVYAGDHRIRAYTKYIHGGGTQGPWFVNYTITQP